MTIIRLYPWKEAMISLPLPFPYRPMSVQSMTIHYLFDVGNVTIVNATDGEPRLVSLDQSQCLLKECLTKGKEINLPNAAGDG